MAAWFSCDPIAWETPIFRDDISCTTEPIAIPLIFLAPLINQAKTIRLGTGVITLPNHRPVTVAGGVAPFDHLAKGRFQPGAEKAHE